MTQQQSRKKDLKVKSQVFIQQTASSNPFGPNYSGLPYATKVSYKYNILKQYIKPTQEDLLYRDYEHQKYLGTIMLGFSSGYFLSAFLSFVTRKAGIFRQKQVVVDFILKTGLIAYGITEGYFQANKRYNLSVCQYFNEKYLQQAIYNGFQNYEIS